MDRNPDDPDRQARSAPQSLADIIALHGRDFIETAYRRLLLRKPDAGGLSNYLGQLRDGRPKVLILDGIARSREGREVAAQLPGLRRLALLQQLARIPVLGMLLRGVSRVEGMAPADRRLRALEEALYAGPAELETAWAHAPGDPWPDSVTDCEIQCLRAPQIGGEMAIVVADCSDGRLQPRTCGLLETLARQGIGVILIIATHSREGFLPAATLDLLRGCVLRAPSGQEFAAWAHILRLYPGLFTVPLLYLISDRLSAQLDDAAFSTALAAVRASEADLIGLTGSHEEVGHIGRHFLALRPGALGYMPVHEFFNGIRCLRSREAEFHAYAVKLLPYLRAQGLRIEVLFTAEQSAVPSTSVDADSPADPSPAADGLRPWQRYGTSRHVAMSPPRIAFIGPWTDDDSAGLVSRGFIAALWHTDLELSLIPVTEPQRSYPPLAAPMSSRSFAGYPDLVIVNVAPSSWDVALNESHRLMIARAGKVVGAWSGERYEIPADRAPLFEQVSAIWAPSTYAADQFRRQAQRPVHVVPWVVPAGAADVGSTRVAALRASMGIAASQRMMLYCMDPAWCPEDRGGLDLIAAFDRAGLAQAGWRLILQVEAGCLTSSMERRLAAACDRVQGVRLVQCVRRRDFMRVLLAAADVYASPHAGTGFGLTLARAMARGLTVVATDFGGSRDYLDASCGYPVPVTLHRQGGDRQYPAASPVYARADVAELAGILLRAASRAAAADGGPEDTGRARIAERYSAGAVAVALRDAVTAVLES